MSCKDSRTTYFATLVLYAVYKPAALLLSLRFRTAIGCFIVAISDCLRRITCSMTYLGNLFE